MKNQIKLISIFILMLMITILANYCYAETYNHFTYSVSNNMVTITGYDNSESKVVIPEKINNMYVTTIGSNAFKNCSNIEEIDTGSVTSIGYGAFQNCTNLHTITISGKLEKGGSDSICKGCDKLKTVVFKNGIKVIPTYLFSGSAIEEITLPDSVKKIEHSAFKNSSLLKVVNLGKVEEIAFSAFENCISLEEITIPKTTKEGSYVGPIFKGCINLTNIILEDGITVVPEGIFSYTNIENVNIPDSVTEVEELAFQNCEKLKSIKLPSSVKQVGYRAFENCTELQSIDLGKIEGISFSAFENCTSLEEILIPKTLTKGSVEPIFKGCTNLKNIVLEQGLKKIPSYLLANTEINEITIPSSVTEINYYAFKNCDKLEKVTILGDVTSIGWYNSYKTKDTIFTDSNENLTVYCYPGIKMAEYVKNTKLKYVFLPIVDINKTTNNTIGEYTYTGSAIKPAVTLEYNDTKLINGFDYTISYSNNINAGTGKITIKGKLGYSGTKIITFKINPKNVNELTYNKISNYNYTGKTITPNVIVKFGSKTLKNKTDYTISYKNNKNAGTATITIKGKGNYTGTKTITFKINPLSIVKYKFSKLKNYTYTGKNLTQKITVQNGKLTLKNKTDYTVTYKNNKNVGIATVTITGKGNYTGTKTLTFKISKKSIAKLTYSKVKDYIYTGVQIKPTVIVKDGKTNLVLNQDYTVAYKSNINKGTATITIVGKGNYTGTKTIKFKINARSISNVKVLGIEDKAYTGKVITQSISLSYNNKILKNKIDYIVTYKNNTKVGTATITISGKGNFTGTLKKTFKIYKETRKEKALKSAKLYIASIDISYQGLIDQLVSDKFTADEAKYAADNCGANWKQEAVDCAKSYLKSIVLSYQGMIDQLKYEKFTDEQAKYGADNCGYVWN